MRTQKPSSPRVRSLRRLVIVVVLVTLCGTRAAAAGQLVPSIGLSRPVDGAGSVRTFLGLAVRDDVLPALTGELAVGYRSESREHDQLEVRTWPVTASLYLRPVPVLYGGAGVGRYQTTFDYAPGLLAPQDETRQLFGVHLGGGMQMPAGPVALDVNGRYVMLRDQHSRLVPEEFDPDFWTLSLGVAIGF